LAEHKHRDDLTGEHRLGDAGQIVLAILFGLIWVLDSFVLHRTTFLNDIVPLWIKVPLAVVFLALAANLARAGLSIVFGERRPIPGVIREGVFGWVRHPIYLGEILLYAGFLMLSLSIAAMVIWLAGIVFLHTISRYEERLLLARFGEEYAHYMREVPMWIPRLRSR
jgi:protein-S-isoprenylcysteine O-methyltransferase Ste14